MWKNLLVTEPRDLRVTIPSVQSLVTIKWFWLSISPGKFLWVSDCHMGPVIQQLRGRV